MAVISFHECLDNLPTYRQLPKQPNLPVGCTWGFWDTGEKQDELGTLNLLTAEVIAHAASEIREGISVSLNWSLAKPNLPVFQRQKLIHTIINNKTKGSPNSFDDEIVINTQSGSQWDGLRHVVHREAGACYNGVCEDQVQETPLLGIDKWHDRGGIVGRGVLIDYVEYASRHHISYSPTEYHAISHDELEEAAREQGTIFRQGDILIVRSGLIKWYNECPDSKARDDFFANPHKQSVGVAPTDEAVEWIWNKHFSAVAGDALAWEPVPYPQDRPCEYHVYCHPTLTRNIVSTGNVQKKLKIPTTSISSASSCSMGDSNWRAMGSGEVGGHMCSPEKIFFLPDECAAECTRRCRLASKCRSYILIYIFSIRPR
jgi:kynurenine formamidase